MIYIPIKQQSVNALKFTGEITSELRDLGITELPSNITGICNRCNQPLSKHVLVGNQIICPNTYIMYEDDQVINLMSSQNFESIYKPLHNLSDFTDVEILEIEVTDASKEI